MLLTRHSYRNDLINRKEELDKIFSSVLQKRGGKISKSQLDFMRYSFVKQAMFFSLETACWLIIKLCFENACSHVKSIRSIRLFYYC